MRRLWAERLRAILLLGALVTVLLLALLLLLTLLSGEQQMPSVYLDY